jgi:hypothetical protein
MAVLAASIVFGGFAIGGIVEFDSTTGRMFRLFVGLLLVIFGLRQARLLPLRMRWLDRVAGFSARVLDPGRVSHPVRRDVAYGFGYLLAGFG